MIVLSLLWERLLEEGEGNIFYFEEQARAKGYRLIAGVDEAGRGPLVGPVVAGACILPEGTELEGINDSKKLTEEKREALYEQIMSLPNCYCGIGVVDAHMIDQVNILQASLIAMQRAVENLPQCADYLLVDGIHLPPVSLPMIALKKGDSRSQSIMAAAILAKVTRDRLMVEIDKRFPGYGFANHKGYATKEHREALGRLGPCPLHRKTFEPIKSMIREVEHA